MRHARERSSVDGQRIHSARATVEEDIHGEEPAGGSRRRVVHGQCVIRPGGTIHRNQLIDHGRQRSSIDDRTVIHELHAGTDRRRHESQLQRTRTRVGRRTDLRQRHIVASRTALVRDEEVHATDRDRRPFRQAGEVSGDSVQEIVGDQDNLLT